MLLFNLIARPLLHGVGTESTSSVHYDLFHSLLRTKSKLSTDEVKKTPCGNGQQQVKRGAKG